MEHGIFIQKERTLTSTIIDNLTVYRFVWDVIDSNTYVIHGKDSSLIIDPIDSVEFLEHINRIQNAIVVLTHAHYDHISGLNQIRETITDTKVIASRTCSINICDPKRNLSNIANPLMAFQEHSSDVEDRVTPFSCEAADIQFSGEMLFRWEGHELLMSEFSGHSPDSICLVLDGKYLFSGDTILPIPTVTRLPGGSTYKFWEEDIPRLNAMSEYIEMVFPGHKSPGTLKDMIGVNHRPERIKRRSI